MFGALARWWRRRCAAPSAAYVDSTTPIDGRVERVKRSDYVATTVHVDRLCEPTVAAPGQQARCTENRGGDFYTDCQSCTACDQIFTAAPDLLAYVQHRRRDDHRSDHHCAFVRPPRTPDELERAIDAMCGSEVCGIRYGGRDPEILRRIAARGSMTDGTTDHPLA